MVLRAGWYAQAAYLFSPGRLQAVVRYDTVDLDRSVPGESRNVFTAGLNWFIAGKTKLQVNYELHRTEGGGTEKSGLLAQLQAGF
jgi:phosphate-selective porin